MRYFAPLVLLAGLVSSKPTPTVQNATLYLCSDSTAANYNPATTPIQGFGYYLGNYLSTNFVNRARGGRSTRSFINEGLWGQLLDMLVPGDYVVIEMGHNDNGTPGTGSDVGKDRAVVPGIGNETVTVTNSTGAEEVVRTFGSYLRQMIKDVEDKSATVVLSGMVPTMSWSSDNKTLATVWPFTEYARAVAEEQKVPFVDHTKYSVARQQALGYTAAKAMYPLDNTHTDAAGATLNAESFVTAVKCASGKWKLKQALLGNNPNATAVNYPCA
ncbi:uncharacterized protein LAJ45_03914 [Morchella importuna]|uniref:SGNH hydrolase n=1 Tax=Morchella conica CCBAS932 TaxID=1392247 RepID=A0A3N4L564_9PEZI|nr:uncharacterized protein LAJ45_03914 [Morchella importuna]KAH8151921.1 hypothetical protein LAJ45_03914 [Morchella importuna]RPB16642.1 SGNH hydrolase [Morchella conica CCBAS932]